MLIAISGSQSCGKTTIINKIRDVGYPVIERKTSRSILTDWDVTLAEINDNVELTVKFQNEIIKRKLEDELDAASDPTTLYFTERTYADLMIYFLLAAGGVNDMSVVVNDYYKQCINNQCIYHKVFYLKSGHFVPEHDGVRGSNIHYSRLVDISMLDMTTQLTQSNKLTVIDTPCLEQRLNIILAHSRLEQ
jgi:predicted ATPase